MGEIKSALELALERTKEVKSDKNAIRVQEIKDEGRRTASKFLLPDEELDMKKIMKGYSKEELVPFRSGFLQTILANLSLPKNDEYQPLLERIGTALQSLSGDDKQIPFMIQQIQQFFQQYRENSTQLGDNLKAQYAPKLKQKEQALRQQLGADVHLDPMMEPEFAEAYRKNMSRLDEQYNNALEGVKEEIASFVL